MNLLPLFDEVLNALIFARVDDQNGWFVPSSARPVRRLGLALDPPEGFIDWVRAERLDAVFLHRPWGLSEPERQWLREADIGVLGYHLAFDERLTTGFNPALAAACGWGAPEVLGHKEGRPLGMICALPAPAAFETVAARLHAEFGGAEQVNDPIKGNEIVTHAAVVGAMTDALVREAHERGAGVYVTGQWRQPARAAVRESGVGVVATGHRRAEMWGLRALAREIRARAADTGPEIVLQGG